ncbi:hypothetical protein P873_08860 [Arenimonas composti TR7-09 = DSM 18010]|uniref:PNPLA domain-containing protein n=1 Tax=Arenimonas composti TR7-09 = DSM 18010 TaxID=1121013 RepID=A0A091BE58_9GAMM|nr:hypothetical protein P873_08860 [Arenimonas composti TR7-09 = DSM 18010]
MRGRIALVLGAGGARGLAHIGVLQVLRERGYEVAGISGSSMGALVGGIFAAGRLDEYCDWACALERRGVLRLLDFAFGSPGLFHGERVIGALRELVGDHRIEELPIPYVAVATDLARQREVWLTRGRLFDAIRASIAIPMIFTPHRVGRRDLVDGGLLAPVPIAPTRAMHVDRVIAVDVNAPAPWNNPLPQAVASPSPAPAVTATDTHAADRDASAGEAGSESALVAGEVAGGPRLRERMAAIWESIVHRAESEPAPAAPKPHGLVDLMARSLDTMQAQMARIQLAQDPPDLLIQVSGESALFYEFWRARELVELGRDAAERALDAAGL